MPRPSRPTFQKRLKEKARMEKQREKMQKRMEAKERKAQEAGFRSSLDIDPDIAGIRPGPQAVPEEWAPFMPDEEEEKAEEEQTVEGR
jgi:hypothetical protein